MKRKEVFFLFCEHIHIHFHFYHQVSLTMLARSAKKPLFHLLFFVCNHIDIHFHFQHQVSLSTFVRSANNLFRLCFFTFTFTFTFTFNIKFHLLLPREAKKNIHSFQMHTRALPGTQFARPRTKHTHSQSGTFMHSGHRTTGEKKEK